MGRRLSLFYFLLHSALSFSQKPNIYNFSLDQGLPSNETYSVYQDRKGFIWFATDNGVARYDGNEIEAFTTKDGLIDPVVFGFHEDENGRLWLRSYSGNLSYLENGEIKSYSNNDKLSEQVSSDILNSIHFEGPDLWFATGKFIGKIDSTGSVTATLIEPTELHFKSVENDHIIGANGVSYKIKTAIINGQKFNISLTDTTYHNKVISAAYWKNEIYISINNDVFKANGRSLERVFSGKAPIVKLYADKNQNLWIGYMKNGVERFSSDQFNDSFQISDLSHKSVTGILDDKENGIWLSTLESGIFHISNLKFEFFASGPDTKVTAVLTSPEYVITGSQNGVINAYHPESKKTVWTTHLPGGPVLSLFKDTKKQLWASTNKTFIFDSIRGKAFKEYKISTSAFAQDNDFMWTVGGLRLTKYSDHGELLAHKLTQSIHRFIFVDDPLIYVAERIGLNIYDKEGKFVIKPDYLKKYKINNILPVNDTTLLITTIGNGLLLLDKNKRIITEFNSSNKFNFNNIYSCIPSDSIFWLGTENGIVALNRNSLGRKIISLKQLNKKGGLRANKINFIALTKTAVWAFSDEGLTTVPINYFIDPVKLPDFYLKKILINNKPEVLGKNAQLNHRSNNIQLIIGFIGFNNQTIVCRYKLFQKDSWKYTTNRTIQLSSLSYGNYAIRLEYSVDNLHWINSNINLNFKIHPPLWQSWYFIMGVSAIIFGIGYLLLIRNEKQKRLHLNQQYAHQQKLLSVEIDTLERERSRISKDLHDSVGNNLVVIKMKIFELFSKHKPMIAHQLEDQFQEVIAEIKRIIFELTPPGFERYGLLTNLNAYIEKLKTNTEIEIEFNASGTEMSDVKKGLLVFRIIQELITNTLKHSKADKITLHVNSFEKELNIIYQDNGIGFPVQTKTSGFGLHNIESRIESLGGSMQKDSGDFGVAFIINIPIIQHD